MLNDNKHGTTGWQQIVHFAKLKSVFVKQAWLKAHKCVCSVLWISISASYLFFQILVIISFSFSDGLPLQFPGFYLYLASTRLRKIQNIMKLFSRFSPVRFCCEHALMNTCWFKHHIELQWHWHCRAGL